MSIFRRLYNWLQSLFTIHYFNKIRFVSRVSDIPDKIGKDAYIVERDGRKRWVVFDCPCTLGHRLTINLSEEREPFWTVKLQKNLLNIHPSVWVGDECHSHFWVKNSDILHTKDFVE